MARPTDAPAHRAAEPALTIDEVRIPIPAVHRRYTTRKLAVTDALDFWSFAGAAANVAMQMANPGVGYGVAESKVDSGALMKRPWKRARTTTQYLAVAILGTEKEIGAFREAVNVAHRQVHSAPGAKVKYNAFDRELQLWVAACLFIGFEDSYQLLNGRMSEDHAENFYQSCATLATSLQVPRDWWPESRAAFDDYWIEACAKVQLDDYVQSYVDDLLHLRMINWPMRLVFGRLLRFLTIGYLPPYFRDQMKVQWSSADQRRFENLFAFVGFVNRFIPRFLRFGGSYALMADLRRRIDSGRPII